MTLQTPQSSYLLLAIDVGNTHITLGLYSGERLEHTWRLQTNRHYTADELGLRLSNLFRAHQLSVDLLTGVCLASVVPSLDVPLVQACQNYLKQVPIVVNSRLPLGIANRYKNPEEVGADRLVNAVAVHHYWKKATIVVDFGTATTFDCVSARGDYLGGVICPGFEFAGEWLASHTAKLPRVTLSEVPRQVLGKTTKESLQSGLFWGYIGLVEGLLKRLSRDMQAKPMVVATGGLAALVGPSLMPRPRIMPELTLDGLRLIWERNR